MNQIIYLLLLFCLLFLIETKAINILLSFVAIMVSLAFILPSLTANIGNIESEYYSYILILVQVSALTILFGFVIMLFPNLSHSTPKSRFNLSFLKDPSKSDENFNNPKYPSVLGFPSEGWYPTIVRSRGTGGRLLDGSLKKIIILISIIISDIIFFYLLIKYPTEIKSFFKFLQSLQSISYIGDNYTTTLETFNNNNTSDTLFLRKIGILLYSVDHNIIKLLVLTIILLLAIISLFFLI